MKATGIVRRIDDLGRVVIPKEIRRTMRIREGDPLEIYTTRDGEVIFKKYSLLGALEDFAAQFCDSLSRSTDFTAAVTDRDAVIAVAGPGKRELMGRALSPQLGPVMENRRIYRCSGGERRIPVSEGVEGLTVAVAAPILCQGDVLGLVLFAAGREQLPGEGEYKLAQAAASFLGKHMEA
jgi:AbrB family transcriptional regulator (stage V sporulation protein T)